MQRVLDQFERLEINTPRTHAPTSANKMPFNYSPYISDLEARTIIEWPPRTQAVCKATDVITKVLSRVEATIKERNMGPTEANQYRRDMIVNVTMGREKLEATRLTFMFYCWKTYEKFRKAQFSENKIRVGGNSPATLLAKMKESTVPGGDENPWPLDKNLDPIRREEEVATIRGWQKELHRSAVHWLIHITTDAARVEICHLLETDRQAGVELTTIDSIFDRLAEAFNTTRANHAQSLRATQLVVRRITTGAVPDSCNTTFRRRQVQISKAKSAPKNPLTLCPVEELTGYLCIFTKIEWEKAEMNLATRGIKYKPAEETPITAAALIEALGEELSKSEWRTQRRAALGQMQWQELIKDQPISMNLCNFNNKSCASLYKYFQMSDNVQKR